MNGNGGPMVPRYAVSCVQFEIEIELEIDIKERHAKDQELDRKTAVIR
jgi:hypothetical protein